MLNKLKKEIKLKRGFIIKTIYMYLLRDLCAQTDISLKSILREKCWYLELFWFVF